MENNDIRIAIAGDLFPRYDFTALSSGDAEKVFGADIFRMFHAADISFCNLEGALTDGFTPIRKCGPIISAPAAVANGLENLGVTCVSLGNNHALDHGKKGYEDTCAALESRGILHFGSGPNSDSLKKYLMFELKGKRICLYSVADAMFNVPQKDYPGAHLYDEYRVCRELADLRKDCDCLIVLFHGGTQFYRFPTPRIIQHFHRMADNGADIVIANHTHCIGTEETYNGSYLLYGQGNFLFYNSNPELATSSLLLEIIIGESGKYEVIKHLARHDGNRVWLDPDQDLSEFEERSRRLAEGDSFETEFNTSCASKRTMFLQNMRGFCFTDKVMKRLLPRDKYLQYLRKQYKEIDILRIIEVLRCEEINEVMEQAMEIYLDAEK